MWPAWSKWWRSELEAQSLAKSVRCHAKQSFTSPDHIRIESSWLRYFVQTLSFCAVNRFARYLLIAALMVSIGAQWAVLQSAAWVGMAVSYSIHEGSVSEGLSKTFDGQHPCALCDVVTKGKGSEKKDPAQGVIKMKMGLFCQAHLIFEAATVGPQFNRAEDEAGLCRQLSPPVPPPRDAAAIV